MHQARNIVTAVSCHQAAQNVCANIYHGCWHESQWPYVYIVMTAENANLGQFEHRLDLPGNILIELLWRYAIVYKSCSAISHVQPNCMFSSDQRRFGDSDKTFMILGCEHACFDTVSICCSEGHDVGYLLHSLAAVAACSRDSCPLKQLDL